LFLYYLICEVLICLKDAEINSVQKETPLEHDERPSFWVND